MNNGGIAQFTNIFHVIQNVTNGVALVSSALVGLMIIVCGIFLMMDRNTEIKARLERFAFLKHILMGYAVILGGTFLVNLLTNAIASGGIKFGM